MTDPDTQTVRDTIDAYIRAKDENRPYLTTHAFDDATSLTMVVKAEAISFPPRATGREAITNILVRDFGKAYENVRTFCLSPPPDRSWTEFSCSWLVGMSDKENRMVRVGCGRYDWSFQPQTPHLAKQLTITIEMMQLLAPEHLCAVMDWLALLPYPWCPIRTAIESAPALAGLEPIRHWMSSENANPSSFIERTSSSGFRPLPGAASHQKSRT